MARLSEAEVGRPAWEDGEYVSQREKNGIEEHRDPYGSQQVCLSLLLAFSCVGGWKSRYIGWLWVGSTARVSLAG